MRHTGGVALAAISIKSSPLPWASRNASFSGMTPNCCLASSITRTSRARIFPLRRCKGSRENEREGNGRLIWPPCVEDDSCGNKDWNLAPSIYVNGCLYILTVARHRRRASFMSEYVRIATARVGTKQQRQSRVCLKDCYLIKSGARHSVRADDVQRTGCAEHMPTADPPLPLRLPPMRRRSRPADIGSKAEMRPARRSENTFKKNLLFGEISAL